MNTEKTKRTLSRRRKIAYIILIVYFVLLGLEMYRSNTTLEVENFEYKSKSLPKGFDGVKIVSVTDYHNHGGDYENELIDTIKEQKPDYIFLVGDIIDRNRNDISKAAGFMKKCAEIAPCYLAYGNHELALKQKEGQFEAYTEAAEKAGVTVLDNDIAELWRGDEMIYLAGTTTVGGFMEVDEKLKALDDSAQLLWIDHYPENFEELSVCAKNNGFDDALFFSGHAHGGLIEVPYTHKGLYAPGQGFFPKYTSGEYHSGGCELLLSRGCGNSGYTLRVFDPFHLVVCTLKAA
ncbi:MAG: metallophosphoesterase [Ruminococcus sp.]|nr:metallophosphoesterase [Ruminococcus sp.]